MRRILPLLLLYVTLDFANPLMPGAVRFEAGSVEIVKADRIARATETTPAPTAAQPVHARPPGAVGIMSRASAQPWVSRRVPFLSGRAVAPRSDVEPSQTEDH